MLKLVKPEVKSVASLENFIDNPIGVMITSSKNKVYDVYSGMLTSVVDAPAETGACVYLDLKPMQSLVMGVPAFWNRRHLGRSLQLPEGNITLGSIFPTEVYDFNLDADDKDFRIRLRNSSAGLIRGLRSQSINRFDVADQVKSGRASFLQHHNAWLLSARD